MQTGGADLSEQYINRILKDERLTYKGNKIDFSQIIESSKKSIATNIVDRLKNVWAEESDLFDAIFLAGGGGELFEPYIQPHFDNRLLKITESQFANAIVERLKKKQAETIRDSYNLKRLSMRSVNLHASEGTCMCVVYKQASADGVMCPQCVGYRASVYQNIEHKQRYFEKFT